MRGMTIFCLILAVPIAIGAYLVWRVRSNVASDKAWAETELSKPVPNPLAYGALGSITLNEGKIAEALPLLKKAVGLEKISAKSASAHLIYVEANLEGMKKGLPGASKHEALAAMASLMTYIERLPQGPQAAAWHGVGKLYQHLEMPAQALQSLKKASDLQPDDWVDMGDGRRYKHRGISSTYQKDYSGAQMQ